MYSSTCHLPDTMTALAAIDEETPCQNSKNPDSILNWVNNAEISSPSTWGSTPRKRNHQPFNGEGDHTGKRRGRGRRTLSEVSGNMMSSSAGGHKDSEIAPVKRRSPRKPSPRKQSTDDTTITPVTPRRAPNLSRGTPDEEQTPRPQASHTFSLDGSTALPPPAYNNDAAKAPSDEDSLSSRRPSERSSMRSTSPVKKFADMWMADRPTNYENLDGHVAERLGGVLKGYERLREISMGISVIPSSLKVCSTC